MPEVFKCSSCSGPLEFTGAKSQKCGFCGSTVLVPPHLLSPQHVVSNYQTPQMGNLAELTEKAMVFGEVKKLIGEGKKIEAIKLYREKFGVGLAEAKDVIEKMERGEPISFTSVSLSSPKTSYSSIDLDPKAVKTFGSYFATFVVLGLVFFFIVGTFVVGYFLNSSSGSTDPISFSEPVSGNHGTSETEPLELLKIGGEGTGVGKFKDNRVVAVDNLGNIYSTDYQGGRIQIFDILGNFKTQWTANGIDLISAIAADRTGNLFVLGHRGITKFDAATGAERAKHTENSLRDIELLPDGRLIAVGRQGIIYFDNNLKVTETFKNAPSDASASSGFISVTADAAGTMYLLDRSSKEIIKFSPQGKFLNRMPHNAGAPNDIALDPKGNIYVSDTSRIYVYSPTGIKVAESKAQQAFGLTFNDAGELFIAARPYVIKQKPLL